MRLCTWFAGIDLDSRYVTGTLGFSSDNQAPRILGSRIIATEPCDWRSHVPQHALDAALIDLGEWFRLETGGALSKVAVALPGDAIHELPSSGEHQFGVPTHIDSDAISLVREQALQRSKALGSLLNFVVRGYELDGHPVPVPPVGAYASSLRVEVISWLARRAALHAVEDAMSGLGLSLGTIVPRMVACAESTVTSAERREGVTVVMVGDRTTECATFINSNVADIFTVPLGRRPLVSQLARACSVSEDVIDQLDLGLMTERAPSDPIVRRVRTVLSAWGTALFTPIRHRLEEHDLSWRLEAGIVIANSGHAFPTLDERASQIVGMPVRFVVARALLERVNGTSRGSFAALGLIPMQWKSRQMASQFVDVDSPEPAPPLVVKSLEPEARGGFGQAIGRWLREFVPADHHS